MTLIVIDCLVHLLSRFIGSVAHSTWNINRIVLVLFLNSAVIDLGHSATALPRELLEEVGLEEGFATHGFSSLFRRAHLSFDEHGGGGGGLILLDQ